MKTQTFSTAKTPRAPRFFLVLFLAFLASWRFDVAEAQLPPETEAQIRKILSAPGLDEGHVGLSILDLGEVENAGAFPAKPSDEKPFRVLLEIDSQKKFLSASNMKLFTAAIALQLLGKDRTFPTRVFRLNEQLLLYGGGDPSLKVSDLEKLAQQVAARGAGTIRGVLGDSSAYNAETFDGKYPLGWTVDDTLWYYGPQVAALAIERNQLDLIVTGAEQTGTPAQVAIASPLAPVLALKPEVATGTIESKPRSRVDFTWQKENFGESISGSAENKNAANGLLSVSGQVAPKEKVSLGIAIPDPPQVAAAAFENALMKAGVSIAPPAVFNLTTERPPLGELELLAQHDSPPVQVLLQRVLKNSDNLYAELMLRNAAFYHDGERNGSARRAHELMRNWLTEQGIDASTLSLRDGSGLSRYSLLTPRATAELLVAINRMKDGEVLWNALPIAGVDGTLRARMRSTPAANNVRAKTGTFSIASSLSGYVTTQSNRRLAVSLYINFARDTAAARRAQDEIFTALAESQ